MNREPIDRSPARLSSTLALVAGLTALGATAILSPSGAAIAAPGLVLLLLGVVRGSRRAVTVGCFVLLLGALAGGVLGPESPAVLIAVAATVLAWDVGEHAINVGEQLGREADTTSGEVAHAAASTLIGAGAATLGYLLYISVAGGKPLTALVLLLFAAIVLTSALDD